MNTRTMRSRLVSSLLVLVAFTYKEGVLVDGSAGFGSNEAKIDDFLVPVFTVAELQSGSRTKHLAEALATTGLISVVGTDKDTPIFASTRQNALTGLCACVKGTQHSHSHARFGAQVEGADSSLLSDGTARTTLATATVGIAPLPLRTAELVAAGCSSNTVQAMDALRDHVAWIAHAFVDALDQLLLVGNKDGHSREVLLERANGKNAFTTVAAIVQASHNLEHFHVYEKAAGGRSAETPVLDVHTDAGLFLAFAPGLPCDPTADSESNDFYLRDQRGALQRAVFPESSVGVMLGVGAEHWLRTSTPLRATRHAVRMPAGQSRAWYGMSKSGWKMCIALQSILLNRSVERQKHSHCRPLVPSFVTAVHTVPQDAIIQDFPKRTFADMRQAMVLSGNRARTYGDDGADDVELRAAVSIGCGASTDASSNGATRIHRRRLQMVDDASACNNATNFFCWMSCLDIPDAKSAVGYLTEGYSLYCLDPAVLVNSGNRVSAAQDACSSGGVVGRTHGDSCMGSWQPTAPGVVSQDVHVDAASLRAASETYCYGGTSMYMDGFHWTDTTCVIYLFPTWILTSAKSLAGACVGTLVFAVSLEAVIWKRRATVQSFPAGWQRLSTSTVFYGLQLTMGYMLMLVVMTYSGPLFLCVVVGLMGGHAAFNGGGAKGKTRAREDAAVVAEKGECCSGGGTESDGGGINNQSDNSESSTGPMIPEGVTPCCQNTL